MLACIFSSTYATTFSDITESHWAYSYVSELTNADVIDGYPDGSFKPENTISRAEFTKLLITSWFNATGMLEFEKVESPIQDHWAGEVLGIAIKYGVVEPNAITIDNIDKPITRIEMAMMVAKADMVFRGNTFSSNSVPEFNDYDEMNAKELRYLSYAVNNGLIKGYPDKTFKPANNMTRAEASTMIYRFLMGGVEEYV